MARACKWTDEQLVLAVEKSKSISEVLKRLNTTSRSSVVNKIAELGLDTCHFSRKKMKGIKRDGTVNASWIKFKIKVNALVPISDWKNVNVLGYILKRYKDFYKCDYSFSYTTAPSKCQELYCINRMIAFLNTNDNNIIKKYIDYVFDEIIIPKNIELKSFAFFFTDTFVFQFKSKLRKMNKLTRSTPLPDQYISIINHLDLPIETYGDLAFAKLAAENDSDDMSSYNVLFSKLTELGFDTNKLDELEG